MNIYRAVTSFFNNSSKKRAYNEKINSGNFCCSCISTDGDVCSGS
ncbi:outer membrane porin [Escherichia phage 3W]|nr:outer membrane porin [Escherichia phage 3W]